MAYFSNGTEAEYWQSENCDRCQHWKLDEATDTYGCPVYDLHFFWNYDQIGDDEAAKEKASILDGFIPREDVHNGECNMLAPVNLVPDRVYKPMRPQGFNLLAAAKWAIENIATAIADLADEEWERIAAAYDEETGGVSIELAMGHMYLQDEAKRIGEYLEREGKAELIIRPETAEDPNA